MDTSMIHLVAHRGFPKYSIENTLSSVQQAQQQGAMWIEIDVQMSADQVLMVFHDADLKRLAQRDELVFQLPQQTLQEIPLYDSRNNAHDRISTLSELMAWVSTTSIQTLFVEVKEEMLQQVGIETCYAALNAVLAAHRTQVCLISFSLDFIDYAMRQGDFSCGIVLHHWGVAAQALALHPQLAFVFCSHRHIPTDYQHSAGTAHWVIYEVGQVELAQRLYTQGFRWMETFELVQLQQDLRALGYGLAS